MGRHQPADQVQLLEITRVYRILGGAIRWDRWRTCQNGHLLNCALRGRRARVRCLTTGQGCRNIHESCQTGYSSYMFKECLQGVVDQIDGGMAGMLMDFEGIPLEVYARDEDFFDVEIVGAEASVLVKAIQRATEMLEAGTTQEVSFTSESLVTLIRVLDETYFIALTLRPDANLGKARYLLRTVAPKVLAELA